MDYKELIEKLRQNLSEKVRYGELVCAPWPYTHQGDLVYEDPFFYEVEEAADAIAELLARVESAEARAQTLEKMVKEYQKDIIPGFKGLLEKAERERDAAVKTIFEYTGCPECECWDSGSNWCEKHDREAEPSDGCSTPEWRGLEGE